MSRTIKVTGTSKISVRPDTIRLIITQTNIEKTYDAAFQESADKKNRLSDALIALSFAKDALKTLNFNINTEYESYQAKDHSWKNRLVGYRYTHRMKLDFPADNLLLGKVLLAVAKCPGEPEFMIQYTVSNPEAVRSELLAKAVCDSKAKAEVLAKAAGVELKDIMSIDYSHGEKEIVSRPVNELMLKECRMAYGAAEDSIAMNIEADDIDVTDTVTIVWDI